MISPQTLGALILEVEDDCSIQFCHELHDGLSQLLMALQAHLQVYDLANRAGKQEKASEELAKSRECLNHAVRECRRLVSIQAGEERDLALSLESLLRESGARWNWSSTDFHDLRESPRSGVSPGAERLLLLLSRRLISAFRRKNGLNTCLELRHEAGPPASLCAAFTVTGEALDAFPFSKETPSNTEEILKKTLRLTEALGGILKVESPAPEELHLAIVIPAGGQWPGMPASLETKEA